ncbi:MAG: class I SAM-dependent methyltransferase [Cyanobacteriota bacterium]
MRTLHTLQVADLIRRYDELGADIRRLVGDTQAVSLVEDENGLRMWQPLILGDGEFYRQLSERNPWYYATAKREYDVAAQYLGGDELLEVGCGEGHFSAWVRQARYTGLELSDHAVATAQRRGLQVLRQDLMAFSEQHPASFDRVCSFQVS